MTKLFKWIGKRFIRNRDARLTLIEEPQTVSGASRSAQSVDEQAVDSFEDEIGFKLPVDYRSALTNGELGKELAGGQCRQDGWNNTLVISVLLGFSQERIADIRYARDLTYCSIPDYLLFIARDISGLQIVMDLRPDHLGKIYIRDHDGPENPNPILSSQDFENQDIDVSWASLYYKIFDNFSDFMSSLAK